MNMQQIFIKNLLALLLPLVMIAAPFSASADEVVGCVSPSKQNGVDVWYCGVTKADEMRRIRIVVDGVVQNVWATQKLICQDDICAKVGTDEYMGAAPRGLYTIPFNYYVGPAENGMTVAYPNGQGPGFKGEMHSGDFGGGSAESNACVDQKIAAFRQENGEEAPIMADVLQEWESECQ